MVYFLNSKVKTHTEDTLKYLFAENEEKNVILGYSIVLRRSPQVTHDRGHVSRCLKDKLKTSLFYLILSINPFFLLDL